MINVISLLILLGKKLKNITLPSCLAPFTVKSAPHLKIILKYVPKGKNLETIFLARINTV